MQRSRGFSLTEVLVSLCLVTSLSLALLKQQWQISQFIQQIVLRFEILLQTDNQQESQSGFSLIELCLSLILMSGILACLLQHYILIKHQYLSVQTTVEHQTDLLTLTESMRMSIRKAGFTPCLPVDYLKVIDHRTGQTQIPSLVATEDRFQTNRMDDVVFVMKTVSQQLQLPLNQVFHRNDVVLMADCYHAEVHTIAAVYQHATYQSIQLSQAPVFEFQSPIYFGLWLSESFFIMHHHNGSGSLAYQAQHTEELTSSVHGMRVNIHQQSGKTLVTILLDLDNKKTYNVMTRMRLS